MITGTSIGVCTLACALPLELQVARPGRLRPLASARPSQPSLSKFVPDELVEPPDAVGS